MKTLAVFCKPAEREEYVLSFVHDAGGMGTALEGIPTACR